MTEIKSCVFCEHFDHDEGHGCDTCGFDPSDSCTKSEESGVHDLTYKTQGERIKISMKCPFFQWTPEILEIMKEEES